MLAPLPHTGLRGHAGHQGTCPLAAAGRGLRWALTAHGGKELPDRPGHRAALSFTRNHVVGTEANPKLFPERAGFWTSTPVHAQGPSLAGTAPVQQSLETPSDAL